MESIDTRLSQALDFSRAVEDLLSGRFQNERPDLNDIRCAIAEVLPKYAGASGDGTTLMFSDGSTAALRGDGTFEVQHPNADLEMEVGKQIFGRTQ